MVTLTRGIKEMAGKIKLTTEKLDEAEQHIRDMEICWMGTKHAVMSLLNMRHNLQAKVADLEGLSHRNNIRVYGVREAAEGTPIITFVENLIRTEFSEEIGPDVDLGN